jgi:hypothetical protein
MEIKDRRKVYVGFAFQHHKNSIGGYHHIEKYLDYDFSINLQNELDFPWFDKPKILVRTLRKLKSIFLGKGAFFGMLRVLYLNYKYNDLCFHFIYPENSIQFINLISQKNKIIFTIHQPTNFYKTKKWKTILKKVDLIICLKLNQVEEINLLSRKSNCIYIPHGLNTEMLEKPSFKKKNQILMVGNWLRNFKLAREVFKEINSINDRIKIVVVTNFENHSYFNGLELELLSKISNKKLSKLYNESAVLFCPLTDFTANNSILEAATFGCHIFIASDTATDFSYFPNEYATFCEAKAETVVPLLIDKASNYNHDINNQLASYILKEYSWKSLAKIIELSINKI